MMDQANKLRNMIKTSQANTNIGEEKIQEPYKDREEEHYIKVYSILSGKGGVGKSNFSVNLAIKLSQKGNRVLILDGDIGMSNVNIILGVDTPMTLGNLFTDENLSIKDIICKTDYGVDLISGGSDLLFMEDLDEYRQKIVMDNLKTLGEYDILIIDNGAGVSKQTLTFGTFAHEIILLSTPEPTAVMDAYRVLKIISKYKLKTRVKMVINQISDISDGNHTFNKLETTASQFLNLKLENLGFIFSDIRVNKSVMDQSPFVIKYPKALASENIEKISENLINNIEYKETKSTIRQFSNRLKKFFG